MTLGVQEIWIDGWRNSNLTWIIFFQWEEKGCQSLPKTLFMNIFKQVDYSHVAHQTDGFWMMDIVIDIKLISYILRVRPQGETLLKRVTKIFRKFNKFKFQHECPLGFGNINVNVKTRIHLLPSSEWWGVNLKSNPLFMKIFQSC